MENQETLYVNRIILGAAGQPISQDNNLLLSLFYWVILTSHTTFETNFSSSELSEEDNNSNICRVCWDRSIFKNTKRDIQNNQNKNENLLGYIS